jgi:hypothetical protein
MIVQIKLQLRKCTRLVQRDVKIWFQSTRQEYSCLQVEEGSVWFEESSKSLVWHD